MQTTPGEAFLAPPAGGARAGRDALDARTIARLTELDDARSLRAMLPTLAALAAVLVAAGTAWTPWVVIPAIPVVAALQHALFVLAHDAAHYRLLSDRRWNDRLGRAIGAVAGISMCTYRVVHRLHHNHLYGALDPDLALNGGYPRGRRYLLRKLATDLSGLTAWKTYRYFFGAPATVDAAGAASRPLDDTSPALRRAARDDARWVIGVQLALPVAALGLGGLDGLARYAVLWVLPAVTVLQAILRLRAIAEHGAPAGTDSPKTAARTHVAGPLARFFLFPQNVGYHVEHHLYPAVPRYRLPELHAALAAAGALEGAQIGTVRGTWSRVYADRAAPAGR